jgi:hypothetical protein
LLLGLALFLASAFDKTVHDSLTSHSGLNTAENYRFSGYRIIFRRQPGAAIVAVGMLIIANFLVAHVGLTVAHEWYSNESTCMKYWVRFSGVSLIVGALFAIAGTIPDQGADVWFKSTNWFYGLEFFMIALATWLCTHIALALQLLMKIGKVEKELVDDEEENEEEFDCCQRNVKMVLMLEIFFAAVAAICLFIIGFRASSMSLDLVAYFAILLFAFCDAKGVEVIFANMRVATPSDLLIKDMHETGDYVFPMQIIDSIEPTENELDDEADAETVGKLNATYMGFEEQIEEETLLSGKS